MPSHAVEFLMIAPDNEPRFQSAGLASLAAKGGTSVTNLLSRIILLPFAAGESAMIVVVGSQAGPAPRMQGIRRAFLQRCLEAVKRELRTYPTFRVTDIRIKDDPSNAARISGRVVVSSGER